MTKKEEFEKKFTIIEKTVGGIKYSPDWKDVYAEMENELWSWIENEIRQAKIGENEYWLSRGYPSYRIDTITLREYIRNRISELEKEKV